MRKARLKKSLRCPLDKPKDREKELIKVKNYLFNHTATMKEVFIHAGVLRENVTRHVATLRDLKQVCKVKIGRCPITGHGKVGFYTTNPALFVQSPQLELFSREVANA